MKQAATILGLYLFAIPFGLLLNKLGVPLAWMIGPMLSTAALVGTGLIKQKIPTHTRPIGQIVVATFVGAHFSPEAFHALRETAPVVIGLALFTLVGALLIARLQMMVFRTDAVSATLSVVPTSPVEASVLAESHGISPTPIIFAQTARIAIIVLVVPLLLFALSGGSTQTIAATPPLYREAGLDGLWIMIVGTLAGIAIFKGLRLTNPYFLGPLLTSSILAALGQQTYVIPVEVLYVAQVILGTWLGSCFRPELWRKSEHILASVAMSSVLLLGLCFAGGYLSSLITDIPISALILGAAPGGVTEMALTADVLGLDVALVTVIHLARIFIIMPSLGKIVSLLKRTETA